MQVPVKKAVKGMMIDPSGRDLQKDNMTFPASTF